MKNNDEDFERLDDPSFVMTHFVDKFNDGAEGDSALLKYASGDWLLRLAQVLESLDEDEHAEIGLQFLQRLQQPAMTIGLRKRATEKVLVVYSESVGLLDLLKVCLPFAVLLPSSRCRRSLSSSSLSSSSLSLLSWSSPSSSSSSSLTLTSDSLPSSSI